MIISNLNIDTIIDCRQHWVDDRTKDLQEEKTYWINIKDLSRFKKLKRTRENSKPGYVDLDYKSLGSTRRKYIKKNYNRILSGECKWDTLYKNMKVDGWLESHPALIMISNRRTKPKIRDGHHRLGISLELGIEICPVKFYYVWKKLI